MTMNHDVSSTCHAKASSRRAVAVLLIFLTLFVTAAIAAPALAALREDPSSFADNELPVGLAVPHFVLALCLAEAFALFDAGRALKQTPLVACRPYRAPPLHSPLSPI